MTRHPEQDSDRHSRASRARPFVGVALLATYSIGARDYVLTRMLSQRYFAELGYGPEQVAYFSDYPALPALLWTINIGAGLMAAVLLLARSRWAVPTALLAASSQLVLILVTFGFMGRWGVLGPRMSLVDLSVWALTVAAWLYARAMRRRHVLG